MVRKLLFVAGGMVIVLSAFAAGFLLGGVLGNTQIYLKQFEAERKAVAPVLAERAFADLEVSMRSNGGIQMSGRVVDQPTYDRLQASIVRILGEIRATDVLYAVSVGP